MIQEEGTKELLEGKKKDLELKVLENCRDLMERTVKVSMINKYQKVSYTEIAFTATDFCNNLRYIFATENVG